MRAAPRWRAATRRRPSVGRAGSANGGSGASSGRITDRSRSWARRLSGWMRRRERSKAGYGMVTVVSQTGIRSLLAEQPRQQPLVLPIVGDDDVCPRADEAVALPGVDAPAVDLVAGHRHGDAAGAAHLLDLDEAVAEAEQLGTVQVVLLQDAVDNHLLGELLVFVQRAINMRAEVRRQPQECLLAADVLQVGAARQVQRQPAAAQRLQQGVTARHRPLLS